VPTRNHKDMDIKKGIKLDKTRISEIGCREFDMQETLTVLRRCGGFGFWRWGANKFTNHRNKALSFRVTGLKHTGNVYITLNASDLYDFVLTSSHGTVKEHVTDLYVDQLFNVMHNHIEIG